MGGLLWQSFEDVRLEKALFNEQVNQTAVAYATAYGSPITYNTVTGESTFNISNFTGAPETSSDSVTQLESDWEAFYVSWQSFYTHGTDQESTLGFPNFPDQGEWNTLMQYEAALKALQARIAALYPTASLVTFAPTAAPGFSLTGFFPSLSPQGNATLTSLVWVGLAFATFYYLGPLLQDAASAWSVRSAAPRKAT